MYPLRRIADVRLAFLAALMITAVTALPVSAGPKGDARDSDVGKMLYGFNVIVLAAGDTAPNRDCGNEIYLTELATIRWSFFPSLSPSFQLQDCDGTDGTAAIWASESLRTYVMVNLRRPKTASLNIVCQDIVDEAIDDLCMVGSFNPPLNFTRKTVENILDGEFEEVMWTISGAWQRFDILIYEKL
jgi:hypothetical protein